MNIREYCAHIGKDPLLVQGAGGNVSWKDEETLWVKASGTWLAEALEKEIFVPVDLHHLQIALEGGNFTVTPKLHSDSTLKPSIETLLHALMPHRVVVHLHAIEILTHLVREKWVTDFHSRLNDPIRWVSVDYQKPGAELARAVSIALKNMPDANVVFLQNHGVVVGGAEIKEVDHLLNRMINILRTLPAPSIEVYPPENTISFKSEIIYHSIADKEIHRLATEAHLFERLTSAWALYPDHVVFLGPHPHTYENMDILMEKLQHSDERPELIFVKEKGVYTTSNFNVAKTAQLRCYYDVLVRQHENYLLKELTPQQVAELLNWDAEHYRKELSK